MTLTLEKTIGTKAEHKGYVFRTEWKCADGVTAQLWPNGNSCKPIVLGDIKGGSGKVGSGEVKKKADYPLGEWNFLEVRKSGDKVSVWLNLSFPTAIKSAAANAAQSCWLAGMGR